MKRLAVIGVIVVALLAVGVYRAKLGAQETETRINAVKAEIRDETQEIAVMKAEEAYLSRPERIGPLAKDKLGLQPASPEQYTAPEMVSKRVGEESTRLAPLEPAPPAADPASTATPTKAALPATTPAPKKERSAP